MMQTDYENKGAIAARGARQKGTIHHWNAERGFGFARPDDGGNDVFVHVKGITERVDQLRIGERIEFAIGTDPRTGKTRAVDVRLID